jgi:hypothetical protein
MIPIVIHDSHGLVAGSMPACQFALICNLSSSSSPNTADNRDGSDDAVWYSAIYNKIHQTNQEHRTYTDGKRYTYSDTAPIAGQQIQGRRQEQYWMHVRLSDPQIYQ